MHIFFSFLYNQCTTWYVVKRVPLRTQFAFRSVLPTRIPGVLLLDHQQALSCSFVVSLHLLQGSLIGSQETRRQCWGAGRPPRRHPISRRPWKQDFRPASKMKLLLSLLCRCCCCCCCNTIDRLQTTDHTTSCCCNTIDRLQTTDHTTSERKGNESLGPFLSKDFCRIFRGVFARDFLYFPYFHFFFPIGRTHS